MRSGKDNSSERPEEKGRGKRVFRILFTVLSVLVLVFSVVVLIFALTNRIQGKSPAIFGHTMHVVMTDSMENAQTEDEIRVGDLVIAKVVTATELETMWLDGKTVDLLFWYDINRDGQEEVVVHRIIDYDGTRYVARGINPKIGENDVQRVKPEDVVGVKTGQSRVFGRILHFFIYYPWVLFLVLGALLLYVIVSEIINIIRLKSGEVKAANEKDLAEIRARARADAIAQLNAAKASGSGEEPANGSSETSDDEPANDPGETADNSPDGDGLGKDV